MGMGTVYRLTETLRHRQAREQTVPDLPRAGLSVDQMLAHIYHGLDPGLDPRSLPLARLNVESHLDKLREEGRVGA